MTNYLMLILSGLFWLGSGPVWAGDFCAEHGRMIALLAKARAAGVPAATLRQELIAPSLPIATQRLMRANIDWVYAVPQAPETLAATAEALCRRTFPPSQP